MLSFKDKIAIALIIIILILFGVSISGQAYEYGISTTNLDELAKQTADNSNILMNVPIDWVDKTISPGTYKHGYYKSCACMYHVQSSNNIPAYKITDILDFEFDGNGVVLKRNGNIINSNASTATLAKTIFDAYSSGNYYNESNWGCSHLKTNIIKAFSNAVQTGGVQAHAPFYNNIRDDDKIFFGGHQIDDYYGTTVENYKGVTKNIADDKITIEER